MRIDLVILLCKAANHGGGSYPLNLCNLRNLRIFNLRDLGLYGFGGADFSAPPKEKQGNILVSGSEIILSIRLVEKSVITLNPFRDFFTLGVRRHGFECFLTKTRIAFN
jgi:hypothetical protein